MATIKRIIEGISVEYASTLRPHVGEYGVYKGKIWKAVASYGVGKSFKITLEREKAKEKVILNSEEYRDVRLLGKPTGHISI